jgi:formate hydrogenlyase subunit 3/multisubunit Na+/H+ antiporter MnhD subunit
VFALLPSAAAAVLIVVSRRHPRVRDFWSVSAAAAQSAIFLAMTPHVLAGNSPAWSGIQLTAGVSLTLRADPLGVLFGTVASVLWLVTTVYSIGYTRALNEHAQTRYFASFAWSLFATVGVALAGNLLTFLCFFELLTLATFPLVIHRESPDAMRAGRVYLAYTLSGGAALLAAAVLVHVAVPNAEFRPGGFLAPQLSGSPLLWPILILGIAGCGVKAAIVPLHSWLPVAMIAPIPVSALLHAVAVVKAGVFGIARVAGFVFGFPLLASLGADRMLAGVAVLTILFASLTALRQQNLKRLLAFSTISHLSYVILGVALGTRETVTGALFHLASHAFLKITLFFTVGALYVGAHAETIASVAGLGRRMPFVVVTFGIAGLLLAGLPPGMALVSKWTLVAGAAGCDAWIAALTLGLSGILNAAYFVPVVLSAYNSGAAEQRLARVPVTMNVAFATSLAIACAAGIVPDLGFQLWSLSSLAAESLTR